MELNAAQEDAIRLSLNPLYRRLVKTMKDKKGQADTSSAIMGIVYEWADAMQSWFHKMEAEAEKELNNDKDLKAYNKLGIRG